jgi:hypothetical protein
VEAALLASWSALSKEAPVLKGENSEARNHVVARATRPLPGALALLFCFDPHA